jgi:LysR family transcriptional regulator, nod-box dependent transcriptional activator
MFLAMRFKGLDLNLLLTLDVLLDERNVSRAAERLFVTQPAVSAALGRLRAYFNDPLLATHGKRMHPTAHALSLHDELKSLLQQIDSVITRSTKFDPATTDRLFRIGLSDYIITVLRGSLIPQLSKLAPGLRLDLQPPSDSLIPSLERGDLDLIVTPEIYTSKNHPAEVLLVEQHVVAGWSGNPLLQEPLTEDRFYESAFVAAELGQIMRTSFAEQHLGARGRSLRVEITASNFSIVPQLLVGTQRLAVMHKRLARAWAKFLPITWQELPFPFADMKEYIQMHSTREHDAGIRWLIQQFREAVAEFDKH